MRFRKRTGAAVTAGMGVAMATFALTVHGTSAVGSSAIAGDREETTKSDVQLVLRIDPGDVTLDGSVSIEFALLNDSDDPIYVYHKLALGGLGGIVLHIADADGRGVESPFHFDALPGPPREGDRYMFARLEPAHFLGGRVRVKVRHLLPTAGRFSIYATYLAPLSRQLFGSEHPVPRTVWQETGVLKSNTVTVEAR